MSLAAINILQEYLQKNRLKLPVYTLIKTEGSQHKPEFTIRVTQGSYIAEGVAMTKKEAKHRAAIAMIRLLNEHSHCIDYAVVSNSNSRISEFITNKTDNPPNEIESSENSISFNAVGKLQEMCARCRKTLPIYEDEGVDEELNFTVRCKINELSVTAKALTKKKAKQLCAEKMRLYLMDMKFFDDFCLDDSQKFNEADVPILELEKLKFDNDEQFSNITERVKQLFPSIRKNAGVTEKGRNNMSLSHIHSIFRNPFQPSVIENFNAYYNSIDFDKTVCSLMDLKNVLNHITEILKIEIISSNLQAAHDKHYVVTHDLNFPPTIKTIGTGTSHDEAEIETIMQTIRAIHLLFAQKNLECI